MFNEKAYREVFSQVTASEDTIRRVMNMTKERKQKRHARSLARIALVAAVVALMAVTVSAAETIQSWFVSFFAGKGGSGLSQGQVEYIEENAMPIADSQTQDGWTVELRSAISDGTTAYVIFHITGPEDMDLTEWTDAEGNVTGQILFGNSGMPGYMTGAADFFTFPAEVKYGSWNQTWLEDSDGLYNTQDLLVRLNPSMKRSTIDPFGREAVYHFRFENIVWSYKDMAYEEELRNGKYAGQNGVRYTEEEMQRLYRWDVLAEGVWEFEICFAQPEDSGETVELLSSPVTTTASIWRWGGEEIAGYATVEETITLTSVKLGHLSLTFTYADCGGMADFDLWEGEQVKYPQVVLKDGTMLVLLSHGNSGNGTVTLETQQPIVFEEVDYILMADGTRIEMPE